MEMDKNITFKDKDFFEKASENPKKHVHLVAIATKPDIIKQAPVYLELKKRGENVILVHTGQHYDFNLSGGLEEEFGLSVDLNLNIRGSLHQKVGQIISRLGDVIMELNSRGKTVVPYVHGDTTTAMAVSNTAFQNESASVHVEAGLRALTPKRQIYREIFKDYSYEKYLSLLSNKENYERGSLEPYPEQFNTRCADVATGLYLAPVKLNAEFLEMEGFMKDRIHIVGNSVADAVKIVEKEAESSNIFEKYPILSDGFARLCIHRRENCSNEKRFKAIFYAMKKLVEEGRNILLISLFATESAIDNFGLRDELNKLKSYKNFIYSEVWPYYKDVIAAMKKCSVCVTDSGSMQEEMNILKIPCVTLRFGSDRPETFIAGCNVPAPPVDSDFITKVVSDAWDNEEMKKVSNLYGEKISEKIADLSLGVIERGEKFFRFEEERVGNIF